MEYFYFPKDGYYLTQGFGKGSYTHTKCKALDVSATYSNNKIYAPYTGKITKKYAVSGHATTIWFVSDNKVICADGIARYVVCMLVHPSEIFNMKVGQSFKQGEFMMTDGDTGHATGKHLHLEVAVYNNKSDVISNWVASKNYALTNGVNPCDYIVLKDNCKIYNETYKATGVKYHIKHQKEVVKAPEYTTGVYKLLSAKYLRKTPVLGNNYVLVKNTTTAMKKALTSSKPNDKAQIKKGTSITILSITTESNGRVWGKNYSGYVCLQNKDGSANAIKQ